MNDPHQNDASLSSDASSAPGQVRVVVDSQVCVAGGQCEMLEPETFRIDDDTAISVVIGTGMLGSERAAIVIDRCPSGALSATP